MIVKNNNPVAPQATHSGLQFERIIFFSDAVFAIAITLLVIEIKVPEIGQHTHSTGFASNGELQQHWPQELRKLAPKLIGFISSFLVIGQYWLNHHRNFGFINRFDRGLLWLNLLLLMGIAFIPFTTGLYSEYPYWPISSMWYTANISIVGIAQWILWRYAIKNNRLIDPSTNPHLVAQISLGHLGVPIAFSLAFLGGVAGISFSIGYTWFIIPLLIRYARRRYDRKTKEPYFAA
ncbi:TMEM175 family protein [Spirosoma gilvum]